MPTRYFVGPALISKARTVPPTIVSAPPSSLSVRYVSAYGMVGLVEFLKSQKLTLPSVDVVTNLLPSLSDFQTRSVTGS